MRADVQIDAFDSGLNVGLGSVFLSLRAEIPATLRSGGGAIVNVTSPAGLEWRGIDNHSVAPGAPSLRRDRQRRCDTPTIGADA